MVLPFSLHSSPPAPPHVLFLFLSHGSPSLGLFLTVARRKFEASSLLRTAVRLADLRTAPPPSSSLKSYSPVANRDILLAQIGPLQPRRSREHRRSSLVSIPGSCAAAGHGSHATAAATVRCAAAFAMNRIRAEPNRTGLQSQIWVR